MAPKTDYTVSSKEEIRRLGRGGSVETHYRIWATSKGGTYFSIEIAEADLSKADVVLTAKAKLLDGI